jgi:hypothetical protein
MPAAGSQSLAAGGQLNRLAEKLRDRPFTTRHGVYRFNSREQADEWMMNLMLSKS